MVTELPKFSLPFASKVLTILQYFPTYSTSVCVMCVCVCVCVRVCACVRVCVCYYSGIIVLTYSVSGMFIGINVEVISIKRLPNGEGTTVNSPNFPAIVSRMTQTLAVICFRKVLYARMQC